jgi:hypothetical protein
MKPRHTNAWHIGRAINSHGINFGSLINRLLPPRALPPGAPGKRRYCPTLTPITSIFRLRYVVLSPRFDIINFMGRRGPTQTASRSLLLTTAYPIYDDFWTIAKGGRRGVFQKQEGNKTFFTVVPLPPEPMTIVGLFNAETVREVKAVCRRSTWMVKQPNSHLARCLPALAPQFLKAKRDRHYPQSDRNSSVAKKFWFVARALAGAAYGLSARRAINIIGTWQTRNNLRQTNLIS